MIRLHPLQRLNNCLVPALCKRDYFVLYLLIVVFDTSFYKLLYRETFWEAFCSSFILILDKCFEVSLFLFLRIIDRFMKKNNPTNFNCFGYVVI